MRPDQRTTRPWMSAVAATYVAWDVMVCKEEGDGKWSFLPVDEDVDLVVVVEEEEEEDCKATAVMESCRGALCHMHTGSWSGEDCAMLTNCPT